MVKLKEIRMVNDNKIKIKAINNFEKGLLGNAEMNLKLAFFDTDNGNTCTYSGTTLSYFDGMSWEVETIWLIVGILMKKFDAGREEIREGLKKVLEQL